MLAKRLLKLTKEKSITDHYNNCLHCTNKNKNKKTTFRVLQTYTKKMYDIIMFYDRNVEYKLELTEFKKE